MSSQHKGAWALQALAGYSARTAEIFGIVNYY